MANGFLSDMEFERRLNDMGDDQLALIKFVAHQQFEMSKLCPVHGKRIDKLESRSRKELGAIGGATTILGGCIVGVIDFFMRR